jgi:hypothetical protein
LYRIPLDCAGRGSVERITVELAAVRASVVRVLAVRVLAVQALAARVSVVGVPSDVGAPLETA